MSYDQRERILLGFKWVAGVIPCHGPNTYPGIADEYRCGFFYHGDDWKMGPQAKARELVIKTVESYGGRVIEPAYTKEVSSTCFQDMFKPHIQESSQIGILTATALNDLKRTPAVVERESGLSSEVLERFIDGKEFDAENCFAITRMLAHIYPLSMKHLVVDNDTSHAGLWHMSQEATQASARVFDRTNSNGATVPYYRYMDTATRCLFITL
jgi:hypothetical protein